MRCAKDTDQRRCERRGDRGRFGDTGSSNSAHMVSGGLGRNCRDDHWQQPKCRTSFGTTLLGEARCASTAALGAGTKTLDTQGIGNVQIGIGTGAITVAANLNLFEKTDLLEQDGIEQHPLILTQNEGFVIRNGATAWPATMTWALGVTVVWAEVATY